MIIAIENNELPDRIRRDGKLGYDILYNKYAPTLYGMILRLVNDTSLAEALLEESLLRIFKDVDSYDAEKGSFFTWSWQIARRISQNALDEIQSKAAESKPTPHDNCPDVLKLVFWSGVSIDETARIMNISVSDVKACLRNELKNATTTTK